MAPPAFVLMYAATQDTSYLHTVDLLWTDTYNLLYDKSEKLFYRDARFVLKPDGTQQLNGNGKKIFWSRGNGWVLGGLVRILQFMPKNYPARPKYELIFKEMCSKVLLYRATMDFGDRVYWIRFNFLHPKHTVVDFIVMQWLGE